MERSPKITKFLDKLTEGGFGKKQSEAKQENICTTCGKPIYPKDFRNLVSIREYDITGNCQKCQDDFFGKD